MNLTQEFSHLREQFNKLNETISTLETIVGTKHSSPGRSTGNVLDMPNTSPRKPHRISRAGRARIAAAAKARWAKVNGGQKRVA
jgi:hypothetical protein